MVVCRRRMNAVVLSSTSLTVILANFSFIWMNYLKQKTSESHILHLWLLPMSLMWSISLLLKNCAVDLDHTKACAVALATCNYVLIVSLSWTWFMMFSDVWAGHLLWDCDTCLSSLSFFCEVFCLPLFPPTSTFGNSNFYLTFSANTWLIDWETSR